ncbi:MAG: hypothetical protein ACF8AM_03855 [Rhodopirellula sp. JB055]|uniref:hypothetical protein n=1 Tax=Rhodopirellula sp. JB055 TaxID=3342846 RepID=UPI00370C8D3F
MVDCSRSSIGIIEVSHAPREDDVLEKCVDSLRLLREHLFVANPGAGHDGESPSARQWCRGYRHHRDAGRQSR